MSAGEGAGVEDGDEPGSLDILDVLDAMASHYGEPMLEMLQRWSWKLFCARWRRLVEYSAAETKRREEQEREAAFQRLQDANARQHAINVGMR